MHRLTKTILAAGYFPENVQCVNIAVVDCWVIMQVIHLISDSLRCLSLDTMSIHRVNTRQDFVRMSLIFGNVSGLSGHLEKKGQKRRKIRILWYFAFVRILAVRIFYHFFDGFTLLQFCLYHL